MSNNILVVGDIGDEIIGITGMASRLPSRYEISFADCSIATSTIREHRRADISLIIVAWSSMQKSKVEQILSAANHMPRGGSGLRIPIIFVASRPQLRKEIESLGIIERNILSAPFSTGVFLRMVQEAAIEYPESRARQDDPVKDSAELVVA
jgi:hypothetical protein